MARTLAFSSLAMGRCMDRAERVLLFGALGMLLVSAGLGAAGEGGAGLLAGSGPALRAHVHAGSLGWITLAVLAVALRMATGSCGSPGSRAWASRLSWLTVAVTVAFVVTDAIGSATARAWAGAAEFAVLVAFAAWLGWLKREATAVRQNSDGGARARAPGRASWSVPNLGMGAALAVLLAGSALGALVAGDGASASLVDAHSATLSVPFVVLAATSVLEWAVLEAGREGGGNGAPPTTAGLVQVGALVLAVAALIAGVLTRNLALVEANVPLELGGIAIFAVRVGPSLLNTELLTGGVSVPKASTGRAGPARASRGRELASGPAGPGQEARPEGAPEASGTGWAWLVAGAVSLAVDVGLVAHLVFEVGQRRYVTAVMIPSWLPFAVDHVTFVAVGTTSLFGAIAAMAGRPERARWPCAGWARADTLAVAGLMAGLAGATVGIGVGSPVLEWVSSAVLGLAVLGAVAVAAARVAATNRR